jgi:hypothetical protein
MNLNSYNIQFSQINATNAAIDTLFEKIAAIESVNKPKRSRNFAAYNKIYNQYTANETSIKALMDNKYISFLVFEDFLNSDNIESSSGFQINERIGALTKEVNSDNIVISTPSKVVISNDKKTLIAEFNDGSIYNEILYSFYSYTGEAATCSSIYFEYSGQKEYFYEPNFRYYNRTVVTDFKSKIPFSPRKVTKVYFTFDEPINTANYKVEFYGNEYTIDEDDFCTVKFSNPKSLTSLKLSKISDESVVPITWSYSDDNISFTVIEFNDIDEGLITLPSGNTEFVVKMEAEYSNINKSELLNTSTVKKNSADIQLNTYSYTLADIGTINSFKISLPYSSYSKIKTQLETIGLNVNDFVTKSNDVYSFNPEFYQEISGTSSVRENLIYFDDVSILNEKVSYANFYIDKTTNTLLTSAFMNAIPFVVELEVESPVYSIADEYFTPYVFDISVKG